MIVSRKTAEGFLGKTLESLGTTDPRMKGKVSYYVLSADGAKNLGGPYTKPDAKQRLKQVEYFKRNPRLSAGMKLKDFDQAALREGTKVELEHTDDRSEARRIAADHLVEDSEYYVKLRAIEGKPGPYTLTKNEGNGTVRTPSHRAIEAKRNATDDYDAGLITKRQMQTVHRRANEILHGHAERRAAVRSPEPNPKPFHQREHDWNEVLIDKGGRKLTRRQILDYYKKNTRNIWPYLEGQTVIVILAPSKNNFILRRKRAKGDKHIRLTKLKGIDDESSFEYWIHRRAIEFHPVLTGKMTPILWLDLDMHTTKGKSARNKLFDKMKKAAPRIRRVFRKFGINRIYVYESGQDGGIHFEGDLKKRQNVDKLRKAFTEALAKAFEDNPVFTTGLTRSGQIRLDTSTFHTLGSLRAPYSMTVTGQAKRRISA